jgi:hypothetical protein
LIKIKPEALTAALGGASYAEAPDNQANESPCRRRPHPDASWQGFSTPLLPGSGRLPPGGIPRYLHKAQRGTHPGRNKTQPLGMPRVPGLETARVTMLKEKRILPRDSDREHPHAFIKAYTGRVVVDRDQIQR